MQRLIRIWAGLDVLTRARPRAPSLGYRGCFLQEDDRRDWVACAGVVTLSASGRAEVRGDEARAFERALLATAPEGVLPESVKDARQ